MKNEQEVFAPCTKCEQEQEMNQCKFRTKQLYTAVQEIALLMSVVLLLVRRKGKRFSFPRSFGNNKRSSIARPERDRFTLRCGVEIMLSIRIYSC